MKKFLLIILLLFPIVVLADDIEIERVRLVTRSEGVNEVEPASYMKNEVYFKNIFSAPEQSVTYRVTVRNNSNEDYKLLVSNEEYKTKYTVNSDGDIIKANETKDITITFEAVSLEDTKTYNDSLLLTINAVKANSNINKDDETLKFGIIAGVCFVVIIVSLNLLKKWPIPMLILLIAAIVVAFMQTKDYLNIIKEEKVVINATLDYNYKSN